LQKKKTLCKYNAVKQQRDAIRRPLIFKSSSNPIRKLYF